MRPCFLTVFRSSGASAHPKFWLLLVGLGFSELWRFGVDVLGFTATARLSGSDVTPFFSASFPQVQRSKTASVTKHASPIFFIATYE